ncbi:hypothetical protein THRCLA_07771 [Thraustotheca clavata]|uniref:FYVE-type domain-containing protein n=1 Tax=Thraustotheca clavata TaxID=74557 RepID=A0A1V9ZC96_9STRA|nr:hypothetical protein THRCLA_07771 [Thraustotheca clavata]
MSRRDDSGHLLGWARSLWKTKAPARPSKAPATRVPEKMPHSTPAPRPIQTTVNMVDRCVWPWGFMDNVETTSRLKLVERGQSALQILYRECKVRGGKTIEQLQNVIDPDESVVHVNGATGVVAKYNKRIQLYTVSAAIEFPAKLHEVLDFVVGNNGEMLLYRVFSEDLQRIELQRLAYSDGYLRTTAATDTIEQYPMTCAVRKAWFKEKNTRQSMSKELFFLDHMEALTTTSFGRVCKSVDNGSHLTMHTTTTMVPRYTHCLFGFYIESISKSLVRLSFYGEHCVPPSEYVSAQDTRLRLKSIAGSLTAVRQTLLRKKIGQQPLHIDPKHVKQEKDCHVCQVCSKPFHFFRRPLICSVCLGPTCNECTNMEDVEAPNGLEFRVPICCHCFDAVQRESTRARPTDLSAYIDEDEWSESSWGDSTVLDGKKRNRFDLQKNCCDCNGADALKACGVCSQFFCHKCLTTEEVTTRRASISAFDLLICHGCKDHREPKYKPIVLEEEDEEFDDASTSFLTHNEASPTSACHDQMGLVLEYDIASNIQCTAIDALRGNACLDLASNKYHDALCEQALTELECSNAYVCLIYKESFMLKGVAGDNFVPTMIPSQCVFNVATIKSFTEPLIVPDALVDDRFKHSPRVQGKERIRFYMGFPAVTVEGILLGTVAIADSSPRLRVHQEHIQTIQRFAHAVVDLIEYRHRLSQSNAITS